jgi:hypothetical protein
MIDLNMSRILTGILFLVLVVVGGLSFYQAAEINRLHQGYKNNADELRLLKAEVVADQVSTTQKLAGLQESVRMINYQRSQAIEATAPIPVRESELSSYIPKDCPPAGSYPSTRRKGNLVIISLACGDSGWGYESVLVRDRLTGKDIVAFVHSTGQLQWKVAGGKEHVLTAVGDKSFGGCNDFGGNDPITVQDLAIDEKRLNVVEQSFSYKDRCLGAFQDTSFEANEQHTGGWLSMHGQEYFVDFNRATVTAAKGE